MAQTTRAAGPRAGRGSRVGTSESRIGWNPGRRASSDPVSVACHRIGNTATAGSPVGQTGEVGGGGNDNLARSSRNG